MAFRTTRFCVIWAPPTGLAGRGRRSCLQELGQYLVLLDAWQRFAIWLLHKHFELTSLKALVGTRHPRAAQNVYTLAGDPADVVKLIGVDERRDPVRVKCSSV